MLRPYHEHPLLQNYSDGRGYGWVAPWYCKECDAAIEGPPFEVGEYVVTKRWEARRLRGDGSRNGSVWRVYMRSQFNKAEKAPVFETTRKREALRHARQLEARRCDIVRALGGDKGSIADNAKEVERLRTLERNEP